ncbi:response regulator [Marinomonas agarivorans]|nr:response regulator [Marinomonas agarivorans]
MNDIPHILLVEDNQDDYEATLRSLKKSHFLNPVHWCKNGKDALDYLYNEGNYADDIETRLPDLILLDLNMPGVDGRQVLKKIKADPKKRSIPVVILTTSKDHKDIEACYDMGASTYIQKPVDFEGLTQAIRTMKDYWFGVAILPDHDNI